jgi:hypothetical protein
MGRPLFVLLMSAKPHAAKQQIVHLYVSRDDVRVRTFQGDIIESQIMPLPKNGMVELYRLSFIMVNMFGYGVETVSLETCYTTTSTDDHPYRTEGCAVLSRPVSFDDLYSADGLGGDDQNGTRLILNQTSGDVSHVRWESKLFDLAQSLW